MSLKHRLRTLALCLPLILGAFAGVPMRLEEVEDLMRSMNQQKVVMVVEDDGENGDASLPELPRLPDEGDE